MESLPYGADGSPTLWLTMTRDLASFCVRDQLPAAPVRRRGRRPAMLRRLASAVVGAAVLLACALPVQAQDTVRVGLILPLTGPFAPTGRQIEAGVRLYMQQHGATVAGKKIEL